MGGRISELVMLLVENWGWLILILISAGSLYGMVSRFLTVKPALGWRVLLFVTLGGTTGMVIWIGDNNLLFTLPVFFGVLRTISPKLFSYFCTLSRRAKRRFFTFSGVMMMRLCTRA